MSLYQNASISILFDIYNFNSNSISNKWFLNRLLAERSTAELARVITGLLLHTILCGHFPFPRSTDDVKIDKGEVRAINKYLHVKGLMSQ